MSEQSEATTDESTGNTLPEPPEYECPYQPGDAGYESAQRSGYYGIMYEGEYEWEPAQCTREAYAEYDATARVGNRRKSIDGKPRRSLKFHTTWLPVYEAVWCVSQIGRYNDFNPDRVIVALKNLPSPVRVVVGREGSPALYLWTTNPCEVANEMRDLSPRGCKQSQPDSIPLCGPDELGGFPRAETYPRRGVGNPIEELEAGEPTLLRCLWT